MNLLAKRLGQLAVLAVALIFFSCEDETSLGYKNPNKKFDVLYAEIPVESSVFRIDSLRTSNYTFSGEGNRFLVGEYTDPSFGRVQASVFTQYYPVSVLPDGAVYDSASLQLAYDFYTYGSRNPSSQIISVFTLEEELKYADLRTYQNWSNLQTAVEPIAQKTIAVNPAIFDKYIEDGKDTVEYITMALQTVLGQNIFDFAMQFRDSTAEDYYENFMSQFKGLAIKSGDSDKIIGFNPSSANTRIIIHYHTNSADSLQFNLTFNSPVVSFNQILADHSGTELEGLVPLTSYDLSQRYVQSGVGIFTKLDFKHFHAFADSVPNAIINSAQLVIDNIIEYDNAPPSGLTLRPIDTSNKVIKWDFNKLEDLQNYSLYNQTVQRDVSSAVYGSSAIIDNNRGLYIQDDRGSSLVMSYDDEAHTYSGYITSFIQKLSVPDARVEFNDFMLYPMSPTAAKSVNRVVFPKDQIKLKIYYTKPLITP